MAKKKHVAPIAEVAHVTNLNDGTVWYDAGDAPFPAAHKDPKDRAHMWQRPERHDETDHAALVHDYEYELPRLLHKHGEHLRVDTPDECDAALADGWTLLPKAVKG